MDNAHSLFIKQKLSQPPQHHPEFLHSHDGANYNHGDTKGTIPIQEQLSSQFCMGRVLGRGAFATVYAATRRPDSSSHITVAIKLIHVHEVAMRRGKRHVRYPTRGTEDRGHDIDRKYGVEKEGNDTSVVPLSSINQEEIDDTDELFFPSRVVDVAQKRRKSALSQDQCNGREDNVAAIWDILRREIEVHRYASRNRHPNIVSLIQSFHDEKASILRNGSMVALVMEYCSGGDLHSYLKRKRDDRRMESKHNSLGGMLCKTLLDENEARHALRHILRGLAFLHSHGIAHRDVKPGNIFISPNEMQLVKPDGGDKQFSLVDCTLKIGDYGLAVKMADDDDWDEAQHTLCGTPSCIAPEIALAAPEPKRQRQNEQLPPDGTKERERHMFGNGYGQPADLWSTGCVLYAMLVGRYPFSRPQRDNNGHQQESIDPDHRVREMINRAVKGEWNIPESINMSTIARALLQKLLSLTPSERGFARGLLSTHPFFTNRASFSSTSSSSYTSSRSSLGVDEGVVSTIFSSKLPASNSQQIELGRRSNVDVVKRIHKRKNSSEFARSQPMSRDSSERSITSELQFSQRNIQCHFVYPIENMFELIPMKYQWTELKLKRNTSGHPVALDFTLYLLPRRNGIVIQCERQRDSRGAWMHITEDGARIYKGELTKEVDGIVNVGQNGEELDLFMANNIMDQAFARSPRKLKQFYYQNRSNMGFQKMSNAKTNQSASKAYHSALDMNVGLSSLMQYPTLHDSPTTHSMPTRLMATETTYSEPKYTNANSSQHASRSTASHTATSSTTYEYPFPAYKRLSTLLSDKSTNFLGLYRRLESVCMRMKSNLSNLSMNLYIRLPQRPRQSSSSNRKIMCKVTTRREISTRSTYIIITYYDGVEIRYNASNERGEILDNGKKVGNFLICTACPTSSSASRSSSSSSSSSSSGYSPSLKLRFQMALTNNQKRRMYAFHLRFASDVVEKFKCVLIDNLNHSGYTNTSTSSHGSAEMNNNSASTMPIKIVVQGSSFHDWVRL